MDINYFLYREQVERGRAAGSPPGNVRLAHREMADAYRDLVHRHSRDLIDTASPGADLKPPRR